MSPVPASCPPQVSVIVPVHNVAAHVAGAIASLKAQTLRDFEAIVIDDGSTDGSAEVVAGAIGADPRFHLLRQENRGLSEARNAGLDRAQGAFIAFLDGDDALDPRFLATLRDTIDRDGTDWAACAITLVYPDGRTVIHPAVHGGAEAGPARVIPMADAREVARLFPSAWNKLYRRALFDGLRFPQSSWFEDHEVFWSVASQGRPLGYSPDPLYLHRRGRPGQITETDSDRVFEQMAVLDRLHPLITGSGMTGVREGFEYLATRLIHERAAALRDRPRRARFLAESRALLARCGCRYDPGSDPEISRGLGLALAGQVPVSVVVLATEAAGLARVLSALDRQSMADFDLTVVAPRALAVPPALPCGLAVDRLGEGDVTAGALAARLAGRSVVTFAPGEAPLPDGLMRLCNLIESTATPLAFAGFQRLTRGYHDGWTDTAAAGRDPQTLPVFGAAIGFGPRQALRQHPVLGNRIARRTLLAEVPADLPVTGDACGVQALVLALGLRSPQVGWSRLPVAEAPDHPADIPNLPTLARRVRDLRDEPGLARGWRGTVYLRLAVHRAEQNRAGGVRFWLRALVHALRAGLLGHDAGAAPDPGLPRRVLWVVRRWRRRAEVASLAGAGDNGSGQR